ncbi:MAG TPA: phosphoglycerate mutase family protein [Ilumatobacteraceae bacterium]|nr:phosphoglycerate mutase family protein [Ilumatobacteraceae bacterium]
MGSSEFVYLVRHAKAGERRVWEGDDLDRPLSRKGWRQAHALGERLADRGATTLHSSPYLRCVQTLEPLAELLGTSVTIDDRLMEDRPFEPVLDLLTDVESGAVLCSHGDVIPATVAALARRGMEVESGADWRKATVWVLKRKGDRITKGRVWPPPS